MRLPVSRFLMLATGLRAREQAAERRQLRAAAYTAWLLGAQLGALHLQSTAAMSGGRAKANTAEYIRNYPPLDRYWRDLGLLDPDEGNDGQRNAQSNNRRRRH